MQFFSCFDSLKCVHYSLNRGVAQSGLARLLREQEAGGSNPLAPTRSLKG